MLSRRRCDQCRRHSDSPAAGHPAPDDGPPAGRCSLAWRAGRDPVGVRGLDLPAFGYGLATLAGTFDITSDRTTFRSPPPDAPGEVRLVERDEAARLLPPVYDAVRVATPGFLARSEHWWAKEVLADPAFARRGHDRKFFAVHERAGQPVAYVIYRVKLEWGDVGSQSQLTIQELMAVDADARREMWRFVFGVDLIAHIRNRFGPPDEPLLLTIAEPRRLDLRLRDGLWLRIVDVAAALEQRGYATDGSVVLEVRDEFMPDAGGRFKLESAAGSARVTPTDEPVDVAARRGRPGDDLPRRVHLRPACSRGTHARACARRPCSSRCPVHDFGHALVAADLLIDAPPSAPVLDRRRRNDPVHRVRDRRNLHPESQCGAAFAAADQLCLAPRGHRDPKSAPHPTPTPTPSATARPVRSPTERPTERPTPRPTRRPRPTPLGGAVVVTFRVIGEEFRILLTDPVDIEIAQRLLEGEAGAEHSQRAHRARRNGRQRGLELVDRSRVARVRRRDDRGLRRPSVPRRGWDPDQRSLLPVERGGHRDRAGRARRPLREQRNARRSRPVRGSSSLANQLR